MVFLHLNPILIVNFTALPNSLIKTRNMHVINYFHRHKLMITFLDVGSFTASKNLALFMAGVTKKVYTCMYVCR